MLQVGALRARYAAGPHEAVPRHALTSFVCTCCRTFCAALVRSADMVSTVDVTSGAEGVAAADLGVLDSDDALLAPAPPTPATPTSLYEHYRRASLAGDARWLPMDPSRHDAPPEALHDPRLARLLAPSPVYALREPGARAPPPPPRALVGNYPAAVDASGVDRNEQRVEWVCASKRAKTERRKVKQTRAPEQRISDAITTAARATAERAAAVKRRHDMRTLHAYSRCERTELLGERAHAHARAHLAQRWTCWVHCWWWTAWRTSRAAVA